MKTAFLDEVFNANPENALPSDDWRHETQINHQIKNGNINGQARRFD
ncbi:hypothetical protein [Corallococcus carmarthensis]|nr:hypothetical protein [Corallococcus carmarthensis]NOK21118.1 hypothetical protein [Corallococcus carmarthensis]